MFEPFYSKSRAMIVYGEYIDGFLNTTALSIRSHQGTDFGPHFIEFN